MIQSSIKILVVSKNDEDFMLIYDLFTHMEDLNIKLDREACLSAGQEKLKSNDYDFCIIEPGVGFDNNDFFQEMKSVNPKLQFWFLSKFGTEFINITIFELETRNLILKCRFHKDTILSGIHFIIKSNNIQKQLETQIAEFENSEQNFLTMANTNLDGLLILDKNGSVIYSNPAAGQVYNCSSKELIGKQLGIPLLQGEKVTLDLVRQDGMNSIVEARFANIKWTNQNAYLVSLRDITEQERLVEALHKASIYDDLTNLFNRREANRMLADEISQCIRYKRSSSVLMFDIDNLKKINDTYGHTNGDKALQWIANIVENEIRTVDKAARFGGDEFLVLLPSISSQAALVPANRICKAIASQPCPIDITNNINLLPLTISMGIAEIPKEGHTVESVIRSADSALYSAKDMGGNCAILFGALGNKE